MSVSRGHWLLAFVVVAVSLIAAAPVRAAPPPVHDLGNAISWGPDTVWNAPPPAPPPALNQEQPRVWKDVMDANQDAAFITLYSAQNAAGEPYLVSYFGPPPAAHEVVTSVNDSGKHPDVHAPMLTWNLPAAGAAAGDPTIDVYADHLAAGARFRPTGSVGRTPDRNRVCATPHQACLGLDFSDDDGFAAVGESWMTWSSVDPFSGLADLAWAPIPFDPFVSPVARLEGLAGNLESFHPQVWGNVIVAERKPAVGNTYIGSVNVAGGSPVQQSVSTDAVNGKDMLYPHIESRPADPAPPGGRVAFLHEFDKGKIAFRDVSAAGVPLGWGAEYKWIADGLEDACLQYFLPPRVGGPPGRGYVLFGTGGECNMATVQGTNLKDGNGHLFLAKLGANPAPPIERQCIFHVAPIRTEAAWRVAPYDIHEDMIVFIAPNGDTQIIRLDMMNPKLSNLENCP